MKRGERITIICETCGTAFKTLKCKTVNGRGKYCSRECADKGRLKRQVVPCEVCSAPIIKYPSTPNKKFCSKKCMGIAQRGHTRKKKTGKMAICTKCGKEFYAQKSRLKNHDLLFCSKLCQVHFFLPNRSGDKAPNYKGGVAIHKNSRTGKQYCIVRGEGKYTSLHRQIAGKVLGRKLKSHEVVHHIDGDGLNNFNDNLLICTISYHTMLHHKMEGGLRGQAY